MVIGNMIGAGVFTTSGFSLAGLQSPGLVVVAWGVGGLVAIAGAASYGQLVRHLPESGRRVFVPFARCTSVIRMHCRLGVANRWIYGADCLRRENV